MQFFFLIENEIGNLEAFALVSVYGPPDADLLEESYHTLHACTYQGQDNLKVVKISDILSVISMQPLPLIGDEQENRWFVVEKSGLDDTELTGYTDPLDEV